MRRLMRPRMRPPALALLAGVAVATTRYAAQVGVLPTRADDGPVLPHDVR